MGTPARERPGGRGFQNTSPWVYLLLLPPFIGLLWPPFYAHNDPTLGGIPFFVWYQFAWVIITSLLTGTVFKLRTGLPFFGRETGTFSDDIADETSRGPGEEGRS